MLPGRKICFYFEKLRWRRSSSSRGDPDRLPAGAWERALGELAALIPVVARTRAADVYSVFVCSDTEQLLLLEHHQGARTFSQSLRGVRPPPEGFSSPWLWS